MTVVYTVILVDDTVGPLSALITFSAAAAHNFRQAIRPKKIPIQK
jgi:hypothetical protein